MYTLMSTTTDKGFRITTREEITTGTVVIGAGQAGLAAGYHLARRQQDFVILEAAASVGTSWEQRWNSLRLFTPAGFTHLPGLPFPAAPRSNPAKDAVAAYLAAYADHFALPIMFDTPARAVYREGSDLMVDSADCQWRTQNVVLASGAHGVPTLPGFTGDLDPNLVQLHSRDYRRPSQIPEGHVVVVGAGNSGAEIALDLATDPAARRRVLLAGRDVGHIPSLGPWTYPLMQKLGRAGVALAQRGLGSGADPLGRIKPGQLEGAGIQRRARVIGARDGQPLLADGATLEVSAIIWCTGLRPNHSLLRLDALDDAGRIQHQAGVVTDHPGLYILGQPYQRTVTSHLLGGVGADANHIVNHLTQRTTSSPAVPSH